MKPDATDIVILGVDPGSSILGFGLIKKNGQKLSHLENGFIHLEKKLSMQEKLARIYDELWQVIQKFSPTHFVLEKIFYHKNAVTVQRLGEVRGICLLLAQKHNMDVHEFSARQAKQAVTSYGNASKEQMQQMVKKLLCLKDLAEENASDALALAICYGCLANFNWIPANKTPHKNTAKELLAKASFYR